MSFFELTWNYKKVFKPLQWDSEDKFKLSHINLVAQIQDKVQSFEKIKTSNNTKNIFAKRKALPHKGP